MPYERDEDPPGKQPIPEESSTDDGVRRRSFLVAVAGATAGLLAGCSENGNGSLPDGSGNGTDYGYGGVPTTEGPTGTATPTVAPTTTTTGPGGLDPETTTPPVPTTTPTTGGPGTTDGPATEDGPGSSGGSNGGTGSGSGNGGTGSGSGNGGTGSGGAGGSDGTSSVARYDFPVVESGQQVSRLLSVADSAWVALGATAPTSVTASVRLTSGSAPVAVTLFGPDGALLEHRYADGSAIDLTGRVTDTGAQYCRVANLGSSEVECLLTLSTPRPRRLTTDGSSVGLDDGSDGIESFAPGETVTASLPGTGMDWFQIDFDSDVRATVSASALDGDGAFALSVYAPGGDLLAHRSTTDGSVTVEATTTETGNHLVRLSNAGDSALTLSVTAEASREDAGGTTTTSEPPATTTTSEPPATTTTTQTTTTQTTTTTTPTTTQTTAPTTTSGGDGGFARLGYGMGGYGGTN